MNEPTTWIQGLDGDWLEGTSPVRELVAQRVQDVPGVLDAVERACREGLTSVGFLTYEAAPALDRALVAHAPDGRLPPAHFLCFDRMRKRAELPPAADRPQLERWQASVSREAYRTAIARIRRSIAAGETYQVNYTLALRSMLHGDPFALFVAMAQRQQACQQAYLQTGAYAICSASPELFVQRRGRLLTARPMKGTAQRGLDYATDCACVEALRNSAKDQAENVMIVDMIRNDLGRLADPGTVRVRELYRVERYPTVLQMTSTVSARSQAGLAATMRAMFPCASVTGAPKVRTMRIIRELEPDPRGVYTGAVGIVFPNGDFRFGVPIRTAVVERATGAVTYGVGSGIVWDSTASGEYEECLAKAAVLTAPPPALALIETLLWEPDGGWFLPDRHLERLRHSAIYFGFTCDEAAVLRALADHIAGSAATARRVRLTLARDGAIGVTSQPLSGAPEPLPVTLAMAAGPIDRHDPRMYHKTTDRAVYSAARAAHPDAFDVVLWNAEDAVTETTIANLVIERAGRRVTPPVAEGLLGGTFRAELLARGELTEARITRGELAAASRIWLINSVRRWIPARLV